MSFDTNEDYIENFLKQPSNINNFIKINKINKPEGIIFLAITKELILSNNYKKSIIDDHLIRISTNEDEVIFDEIGINLDIYKESLTSFNDFLELLRDSNKIFKKFIDSRIFKKFIDSRIFKIFTDYKIVKKIKLSIDYINNEIDNINKEIHNINKKLNIFSDNFILLDTGYISEKEFIDKYQKLKNNYDNFYEKYILFKEGFVSDLLNIVNIINEKISTNDLKELFLEFLDIKDISTETGGKRLRSTKKKRKIKSKKRVKLGKRKRNKKTKRYNK